MADRIPVRRLIFGWLCCGCFIALLFGTSAINAQITDYRVPLSWKQDAELTDIQFIDSNHGWIVGDRGLVMTTDDGGKKWRYVTLNSHRDETQEFTIHCRLESVFFASPTHGWIAGGYSNASSTTSTGVLFATIDGGQSWKRLVGVALPKINALFFTTPQEGIAIGDGNSRQPAGVFETRDGGRSWSTSVTGKVRSWSVGSYAKGVTVMASSDGTLARHTLQELSESLVQTPKEGFSAQGKIRELRMLDERFGFAVGDMGRFIITRNGGYSWDAVDTDIEESVDFQTVEMHGDRIWLAGNPGSKIWSRTIDQSVWQPLPTPISTPITQLEFIDQNEGWAIGLCGDVIHTTDGGLTWEIQRRGMGGVALLQVADRTEDFIPELFSKFCGDEDYIGAALLMNGSEPSEQPGVLSADAPTLDHLRQAMSRVGAGFVVDRSPPSNPPATFQTLGPPAVLARQIRALKPRVIALSSGRAKNSNNLRSIVLHAVKLASESNDKIRTSLPPWQVGKVVVIDRGEVASLKISPGHYMTDLGALLTDHSALSRVLLNQSVRDTSSISLTTIFTSPYAAGPNNRLFAGIENTDAGVPVRKGARRTAGNMAQMRLLAGKRKTLDRMVAGSPNVSAAIWGRTLSEFSMQLDDAAAGVWLYELANLCEATGSPEIAAQTHLYLTKQYRGHPLTTASFRWLYNYYSSAEQAHIAALSAKEVQSTPLEPATSGSTPLTRPVQQSFGNVNVVAWEVEDPRNENRPLPTIEWSEDDRKNLFRRRFQQARSIGQSFSLVDPTALDQGQHALARIGLTRRLDPMISVTEQLKRLANSADAPVKKVALGELAIAHRQSELGMQPHLVCSPTQSKPWLDGHLSDPIWQEAIARKSMVHLPHIEKTQRDEIFFAADDTFLYIAVRCHLHADQNHPLPEDARARDARLDTADRVEIAIDIDRDYKTFFLFSVDASGRVADSFGDNREWNPVWYVANHIDRDNWTAEIAIPLEEISTYGDFWSVSASRHSRNRLISRTSQPTPEKPAVAMGIHPSLHSAANEQRTAMHSLPLQSFRLLKMPWAVRKTP
ncbi:MAG: YCF48-related protein [Pirellulaceae bacterium]|nr:YCF48-related protein [Pirellulaceae bacterium]